MTDKQFEEYKNLKNEIAPLLKFLNSYGNRYHNNLFAKYNFLIDTYQKVFVLRKKWHIGSIPDNSCELPYELQKRIIEVIEQYVDEKQKELDEI